MIGFGGALSDIDIFVGPFEAFKWPPRKLVG
jgi:hypothetical protein